MKSPLFKRRVGYALLAIAVLAVVFHATILRALAMPLRAGDARVNAKYLLLLRSARLAEPAFDFAADFAKRDPERRVIVFRDYLRRAEAIGASPAFVETAITQLVDYGVPENQIAVIGDPNILTTGETLTFASKWLVRQDRAAEMLVVTHLFRTSYTAATADDCIEPAFRSRLHVIGFPKHDVTESNWWKSRAGLKNFLSDFLRRIHLEVFGARRPEITWDADEYERTLRELNP